MRALRKNLKKIGEYVVHQSHRDEVKVTEIHKSSQEFTEIVYKLNDYTNFQSISVYLCETLCVSL
jgi:hypothetical protein